MTLYHIITLRSCSGRPDSWSSAPQISGWATAGCLISVPQQVSFMLPLLITAAGAEGKWRKRRGLSGWALIRCGDGGEPGDNLWLGFYQACEGTFTF